MAKKRRTIQVPVGPTDALPESPILRRSDRAVREFPALHVNGVPVPEELAHAIPYDNTDEGIAERNARENVREDAGRVEVGAGPREHAIRQRREFLETGMEPWEAPDPMRQLAEEHVAPGMRPRFLSPRVIKKQGTRGFEVVADERGDPVRCGELVLAQMPAEKAAQRNTFYQDKAAADLAEVRNEYVEKQARFIRDAGLDAAITAQAILGPTERVSGADRSDRIGLHSVRGNEQELAG